MFGSWLITEFVEMGSEWQIDFWRSKGTNSKAALEEKIVRSLAQSKVTRDSKGSQGKYMPLSWYERQGFNIEDIQENCTDIEEHAVLGECYRVDISEVSTFQVEETVRTRI